MAHQAVATPLLLVAVLFFGFGLVRMIRIFGARITPFHIVFSLFTIECLTQFFPVVQTGGEVTRTLDIDTEIFVVLASMTLLLGSFLVRPGGEFRADRYQVTPLLPLWMLAPVMLAITAVVFAVNVHRLGTLPIIALKADKGYLGPTETVMPFFSPLSWGLGRCLTVLSAFQIINNEQRWVVFVRRNFILLVCTAIGVIVNTLDGMRNNLILPVLIIFFGYGRRFPIPVKKVAVLGACCAGFFIIIGSLRVGKGDWKQTISVSSGNKYVDTIMSWSLTYTEPQLQNLDAVIQSSPSLSYGLIIVSEILPGPAKTALFDLPETTGEYMDEKGLVVHQGLTYRTIYADLYSDFGYLGSLLVGALFFAISARVFTRAGRTPRMLLIYLTMIPGIVFFPLLNWYLSLTNLLPYGLLLLFHVRKERSGPNPRRNVPLLERAHMATAGLAVATEVD